MIKEFIYNIDNDRILYYTILSVDNVASYVYNKKTFKNSKVGINRIHTNKNNRKFFKKLNIKIYL